MSDSDGPKDALQQKLRDLPKIVRDIHAALVANPDGLDIVEIRKIVAPSSVQQHLDRRLRTLDPHFVIERFRKNGRFAYKLIRPRAEGEWDYATIPKQLAARIRHAANGRCQMCGKTVAEDHIKLHIDHRIPRSWGGETTPENLWAICSPCNEGKKDYFATFDQELMKDVLADESPHGRMIQTLRLHYQKWVVCDLLEFVANFNDWQTDWRKRLREIRVLGYEYEFRRVKQGKRHLSEYRLMNWFEPPTNIAQEIRKLEKEGKPKKGQPTVEEEED